MKIFLGKNIIVIGGIGLGALAGFLYWNFIGCNSGHCAITSVWTNSTIYGSVMGGLLASTFKKSKEKE
jgi:hypothetical protein